MYDYIIGEYIKGLTLEDIKNLATRHQVSLNDHDAKVIYDTVKRDWMIFYKGDPSNSWERLKTEVEPATFKVLQETYQKAKEKYHF